MKALVVGLVLVVLAAAGIAFYFINQAPAPLPTLEIKNQTKTEDKMVIEDKETIDSVKTIGPDDAKASPYQEYSKDTFETNAGKKTRMLFFYADWCPECRLIDADIKANLDKIPGDIEIIRVNFRDTATDADEERLAAKYGITYQHTFVQIDSAGNALTKWNGGDFEKLLSHIKSVSSTADGKNWLEPQ